MDRAESERLAGKGAAILCTSRQGAGKRRDIFAPSLPCGVPSPRHLTAGLEGLCFISRTVAHRHTQTALVTHDPEQTSGRGSGRHGTWTKLAARLILLRQHPILGPEVMSGVGDKLPVAWMIDGFDSDDNPHQPGIMLLMCLTSSVSALAGPVIRTAPASAID